MPEIKLERIDEILSNTRQRESAMPDFYYTGIVEIDQQLKGVGEEELMIIASRPGSGEIDFLITIVCDALRNKKPVLFCTENRSLKWYIYRLLSAYHEINFHTIYRQKEASKSIRDKIANIASLPIFFTNKPRLVNDLIKPIQKINSISHVPPLIIVENLSIFCSEKNLYSSYSHQDILEQLKNLATEFSIPIVSHTIASQRVKKQENIRPVISDFEHLKNSELLIDKIVSLHPVLIDEEDKKMDATEINFATIDSIEVDILKNETGDIGTLTVDYEMQYCRLTSYTPEYMK